MNKSVIAAVTVTAAAALLLSGCSGPAEGTSGTTSLTIGVLPGADLAPLYLGVSQGFFSDQGIDLNINSMATSSGAIIDAVEAGNYDIGYSDTLSLLSAIEDEAPLSIISGAASSSGDPALDYAAIIVKPDSGIASLQDLEYRTVSVDALGTTNELVLRSLMDSTGAHSSALVVQEVPFIDATKALTDGRLDAAFVVEPFATTARLDGMKVISYPYAEFDPDLTVSAYFVSSSMSEDAADVIDRFKLALQESIDYAQAEPYEVRTNINTYISSGADIRNRLALPTFSTEIDLDSTQKLVDEARRLERLKTDIDLNTVLPK